jgi:soluble lytic murein transglycosylase-like protein
MFSSKIQSLIDTSGESAAKARAAQLINYVNNFNKVQTPQTSTISNNTNITKPKFQDILQESIEEDPYKFRSTDSTNKVVFGSLVKATKPTTGANKTYSKQEISNIISEISAKHGVNEKLVKALIRQESGFNPTIESKAGAVGLMQLMPATAESMGVTDRKDPVQNVEGGVKYLKSLMKKYNGNLILSLAAYNAGPGAVDKYGGVPPYKETQNYVKNILANYLK